MLLVRISHTVPGEAALHIKRKQEITIDKTLIFYSPFEKAPMHATGVYLQTMSVGFKVAQTENYNVQTLGELRMRGTTN